MAPRILATCSRCVFKSFKKFERWSERFVSRIGPFFVGLAVILIGGCAFTYFDVVFRERFLAPDTSYAALILGSAWSAWLYYKAITVPPGTPLDPPRATPDRRAWPALVPSALCVGPLRGLATQGKDDRRKSKVVRDIAAAQERRLAGSSSGGGGGGVTPSASGPAASQNPDGRSARAQRHERVCRKCPEGPAGPPVKPERTHHCSVCRKCTLKFDHHCPWISGCVGLHNERYFLLFLCYFSVACGTVSVLGWKSLLASLAWGTVIWLVALGETAVESHDNDWYRKTAKARGRTFRNPYHLGWRQNLAEFFNVGPNGYHWSTILLPIEVPPASDGWTYQKIQGWQEFAMEFDDELTDEEEMSDEE